MLYDKGLNSFNAVTVDHPDAVELPVFLRRESEHEGPISDLIYDRKELDKQITRAKRKFPKRKLIIVEFLDSKESNGLYYKYTHFRLGKKLVFGGMVCGEPWCLKFPYYRGEDAINREREFAESIFQHYE